MELINLTIIGDPIPKGRPRLTRDGRAYTPARTHRAEQAIKYNYRRNYHSYQIDPKTPLKLSAVFYLRKPKTRYDLSEGDYCLKHVDTDNLLKLVSDALNGTAYQDDCQVVQMTAEKRWSTNPRTEISLQSLNDTEYNNE